jgi:hypothetical protein
LDLKELATLIGNEEVCCNYGCCGEMEDVMQLTEAWAGVNPRFWQPVFSEGDFRIVFAQPGTHTKAKTWRLCTPQGVINVVEP